MTTGDPSLGGQNTVPPGDELPEGIHSIGELLTNRQRKRFKAGDVLCGRYKILGELGQGGMGLVFRCMDEVGGVEVAVKMLPPEVSHDTSEMEEVRENFQLVHRLHHPNIAGLQTLERDPATGEYLLVMEMAPGMSLRRWRKEKGRQQKAEGGTGDALPLERVLPMLRQMAGALDYAHAQKVIHRDVKPSNVMVAPDGTVKVLDFGLAAQIHTSFSRVSHVKYGTSGTGPYMAPEQWEGRYQDAATDQYALGVLTYELLTGRCPFENPDAMVLRNAVLHSKPERPAGLSDAAWAALSRALAKQREERFSTCTAFVEALGGTGVEPRRTQRARRDEGGRPRFPLGLVIGLGLAVVVALGWWGKYASAGKKWKPAQVTGTADWLGPKTRAVGLEEQRYPDLRSPWENGLGMKFNPVAGLDGVLFCVWETRVQDFKAFRPQQDCGSEAVHPAVNVTWDDAVAFCAWLTESERAAGRISPNQAYRLPKDWEWSMAVGLTQESRGGTPKSKDEAIKEVYPWSGGRGTWPPGRGAGNYASSLGVDSLFDGTSPVGSFTANANGLFDLGGNVWEWCEDFYDGQSGPRVLRGASWHFYVSRYLLSSYRYGVVPAFRDGDLGFRVVLASSP